MCDGMWYNMCLEKIKSGARKEGMEWQQKVLSRVVKVGLSEKVMFKQRPERGEGVIQADIWGESFQAEGTGRVRQ